MAKKKIRKKAAARPAKARQTKTEFALTILVLIFTALTLVLVSVAQDKQDAGLGNIGLACGFVVFFFGFVRWMLKQSKK